MKQIALKYFSDTDWSLFALVLFFGSFVFLIYRVYFFEPSENFEKLAELPLKPEEVEYVD